MSSALIVDASPFILLGRVGRLDLLASAAPRIVAPAAVLREVDAGAPRDRGGEAVRALACVLFVDDLEVPDSIRAWDLGAGEALVLAHALQHAGAEAVLDDLAARKCAAGLRVPVVGTLGLVLRAKARGHLTLARPVVEMLCDNGMRGAPGLVDAALAKVEE